MDEVLQQSHSVLKFTPLSQEQISKTLFILRQRNPDISDVVPYFSQAIQDPRNQKLIESYKRSADKKDFLEKNLVEIALFLNECRLIGYYNEFGDHKKEVDEEIEEEAKKGAFGSKAEKQREFEKRIRLQVLKGMLIGSEAIEIMCAYLIAKEKNEGQFKHEIQVVKNTTYQSDSGSKKHSDIFLEGNCIHSNFYNILSKDLQENQGDFHKTYLVELFGVTGGDHVTTITVHKKAGDKAPIFDLFDSSPTITRNGLTPTQNSIANGWSPIAINATIKKACEDSGLHFRNENFFNNSQPLQQGGYSMCAIFAYEIAIAIAKMTPEEHLRLLRENYTHQSVYGGLTEMAVKLDVQGFHQIEGDNKQLKISPLFTQFSHFVDSAINPIATDFLGYNHERKSGESETLWERFLRYENEDKSSGALGSSLIWQKTIRQKLGHLFEIVTNEEFVTVAASCKKVASKKDSARDRLEFEGDPHFPATEMDPRLRSFEETFNKLLPRTNKINHGSIDAAGNYEFTIYTGNSTADKLSEFLGKNFSLAQHSEQNTKNIFKLEPVNLSNETIGLDPQLQSITKISLTLTPSKAKEMIAIISAQDLKFSKIFTPQPHQFSIPPKKIETVQGAKRLATQQQKTPSS